MWKKSVCKTLYLRAILAEVIPAVTVVLDVLCLFVG